MKHGDLFQHAGVDLEVRNVVKVYRTAAEEVHALRNVDWSTKAGTAVAIMGPSGCGKSTLMNVIGGVDRATSGSVFIDGTDLARESERALENYRLRSVGFVFQFFNLVPTMSAFENLELPMLIAGKPEAECRDRAHALLEIVGLAEKGNKRPDQLSGGEQQRVGVMLALANDPPLILADEPTGNLDGKNADIVSDLLVSLAQDYGKTVIMVSHDPKSVAHFPEVYAMRDGNFVPYSKEGGESLSMAVATPA